MGVSLKEVISKKEVDLKDFKDKTLVIDGYNILYQFLTTIRSPEGEVFTDSKGNVTSHLIGAFNRLSRFLNSGIKPVFVFDGTTPTLKKEEKERRKNLKEEAEAKYRIAVKEGNKEEMKKYSSRTAVLTEEMVEEAKKLLSLMGIPFLNAPSEGEAQAAYMVKNDQAYACVSQDYDCLLFGCPFLITNLSIAGRRRKIKGMGYKTIKPELINLSEVLNELGLDQDGLIAMGMLIGTDYNLGGIKGIGPKKALTKVRSYIGDYDKMFKDLGWDDHFDFSWEEVFYLFKKTQTTDQFSLEWKGVDEESLREFLINQHEFSSERVENTLKKLRKKDEEKKQKGLGDYF